MKVRIILFLCSLALSVSAQTTLQQLAGEWHFVASNEGEEIAPGVYKAGIDDFPFTATVSQDGTALDCHADCLYRDKNGKEYAADWQIVVEEQFVHPLCWWFQLYRGVDQSEGATQCLLDSPSDSQS